MITNKRLFWGFSRLYFLVDNHFGIKSLNNLWPDVSAWFTQDWSPVVRTFQSDFFFQWLRRYWNKLMEYWQLWSDFHIFIDNSLELFQRKFDALARYICCRDMVTDVGCQGQIKSHMISLYMIIEVSQKVFHLDNGMLSCITWYVFS